MLILKSEGAFDASPLAEPVGHPFTGLRDHVCPQTVLE